MALDIKLQWRVHWLRSIQANSVIVSQYCIIWFFCAHMSTSAHVWVRTWECARAHSTVTPPSACDPLRTCGYACALLLVHILLFVCLLFYAIATVFQLYHGSDRMYEMRRRKPETTLLPTQVKFNLQHHMGMVWEELAFDDAVSYTQRGNGLQHS